MVNTKLSFHPSKPLSQWAFSVGGQDPYFQVSKTNRSPEALILTPGPNFIYFLKLPHIFCPETLSAPKHYNP